MWWTTSSLAHTLIEKLIALNRLTVIIRFGFSVFDKDSQQRTETQKEVKDPKPKAQSTTFDESIVQVWLWCMINAHI